MNDINFEKRISIKQVEESTELAPKFDQDNSNLIKDEERILFKDLNENDGRLDIES